MDYATTHAPTIHGTGIVSYMWFVVFMVNLKVKIPYMDTMVWIGSEATIPLQYLRILRCSAQDAESNRYSWSFSSGIPEVRGLGVGSGDDASLHQKNKSLHQQNLRCKKRLFLKSFRESKGKDDISSEYDISSSPQLPHCSAVSYLSITCHISVCHFRIPHSSPLIFSAALIVTFPHQKKSNKPKIARATKQRNKPTPFFSLPVAPRPRSLLACQVTCCYLRLYGQNCTLTGNYRVGFRLPKHVALFQGERVALVPLRFTCYETP